MLLKKGSSQKTISYNLRVLVNANVPFEQALTIATQMAKKQNSQIRGGRYRASPNRKNVQ